MKVPCVAKESVVLRTASSVPLVSHAGQCPQTLWTVIFLSIALGSLLIALGMYTGRMDRCVMMVVTFATQEHVRFAITNVTDSLVYIFCICYRKRPYLVFK